MTIKFNKKVNRKGFLTARLIFYDWGWPDNITYKNTAKINEKEKGIMMVEQIREKFGITDKDLRGLRDKMIDFQRREHPVMFTRDEKGNIISPFRKRAKKTEED